MPELPEVETTARALAAALAGRRIARVVVRSAALRWPVPADLPDRLAGAPVRDVSRRAKYLLLRTGAGCVLVHLGMSGSLRVVPADAPPRRHDHVDFVLDDERCVRLHDPRRFGAVLWAGDDPLAHPLLAGLGPEPLECEPGALGAHLFRAARGRRVAVKALVMDAAVVVGVGNIYATEALFEAGIRPARAAGRVSLTAYTRLAGAIQAVLRRALAAGGTTLRDYVQSDGAPGYFALELAVYGRAGAPCPRCGAPVRTLTLGQRASSYCPRCQR